MSTGDLTGNWKDKLVEMQKSLSKIARKEVLEPLSAALAQTAIDRATAEFASKTMPAATLYAKSTAKGFLVGTNKIGAAMLQYGGTIRPKAINQIGRAAQLAAHKDARAIHGGKTFDARALIRQAGYIARKLAIEAAKEHVDYITFRAYGHWLRMREVKFRPRTLLPVVATPSSWESAFAATGGEVMASLFPDMK